jgi:hypothetical protein
MLDPSSWTQVVTPIITLSAILVALFKERIIALLYRPKLTVMARQHPPDIDLCPVAYPWLGTPPGARPVYQWANCYFLRL